MAQRSSNIKINLDNKQAVDGLNTMNKSVKETGKQVENASTRLRKMRDELLTLERGSKAFNKLEREAANLQDQVDTVNQRVRALSSDTFALEGAVGVIGGMATAYSGVTAATALLGVENEELMQVLVKLQGVQQLSNSIQQVALLLRKESVTMIFLQIKAQKIRNFVRSLSNRLDRAAIGITRGLTGATVSQTGATIAGTTATRGMTLATRALGIAMKALPILAIVGGITALVGLMGDWGDESELAEVKQRKLTEQSKELNKTLNEQQEAFERVAGTFRDRRSRKQTLEQIDLEKQIIKAADELSTIKRKDPENIEKIIEKTQTLFNLEEKLSKDKKQFELNEFDRQVEEDRDRITRLNRIRNTMAAGSAERKEAQKELERVITRWENRTENRRILEGKLDNNLYKQRLSNIQKVADLRSKLNKDGEAEFRESITGVSQLQSKSFEDMFGEIPNTIKSDYVAPWFKAISEVAKERHDKYKEEVALNEELTRRSINNVYRLSDGISAAIDRDFRNVNENMRLIMDDMLGEEGLFAKFRDEGIEFGEWFKENITDMVAEIGSVTTHILAKMSDQFLETETRKIDRLNEDQTNSLARQLSERTISQEEYQNRITELEQETEMQKRQLQLDTFNRNKRLAMAEAGILTAQSIIKSIAQFGVPLPPNILGMTAVGMATSMGAIQMGLIGSQTFQASRGGVVPGEGLGSQDTVPSMLAPGEVVINSKSAKAFLPLLSALNEAGGGIQLAPDIEDTTSSRPKVYKKDKAPIQTFVSFDSMDAMNKQVNRTIKNNTF